MRSGHHFNQHADPRLWLHAAMATCASTFGLDNAYGQHEFATLSNSGIFGRFNHGCRDQLIGLNPDLLCLLHQIFLLAYIACSCLQAQSTPVCQQGFEVAQAAPHSPQGCLLAVLTVS